MNGKALFLFLLIATWLLTRCQQQLPSIAESKDRIKADAKQLAEESRRPDLLPLFEVMKVVEPLHTPMGRPRRGDWLDSQKEPGQTFIEYLRSNPVVPDEKRRVLYIQPLGEFTAAQRSVVKLAAEYLAIFFKLEVRTQPDLPLSIIPQTARRKSKTPPDPFTRQTAKTEQLLTGHILMNVLKPALPADAVALLAFTAADLWPGEGWNFVFGQASLHDRVGVWSIHRFGNPDRAGEYELCLVRTLKLASHETGHMFSMPHCTKYECNLSGTNHLEETDRRPLDACPECMAKICWAMKVDPQQRYQRLAQFCQAQGLTRGHEFFAASAQRLNDFRLN